LDIIDFDSIMKHIPPHLCEMVEGERFFWQLTEDWKDIFEDENFETLRRQLVSEIGNEFFLDTKNPGKKCIVPKFRLSP